MLLWWPLLAEARPPDVVLVSMDTVRADAISAYGVPPGPYRAPTVVTPVLDAVAARGVRFDRFFAHAPSTLSSHASMFTGLDPHGHAVPRNGFPLSADHPLLAEVLRGEGYDTIAIVGSAALSAPMGLTRGFRVYDDDQGALSGGVYQSTAEEVVQRALAAVDARPDPARPLFLFVHFYDAHAPYTPPAAFDRFADPRAPAAMRSDGREFSSFVQRMRRGQATAPEIERIASLYLGEVAYVDAQIGALLDGLAARGLLPADGARPGLLVVTADHGETLGDDPIYAWSHGSNVGYEVMHVPLLVEGRGVPLAQGAVVRDAVGMNALAPTLLEWLGADGALGAGGSFAALAAPAPAHDWQSRPIFFEATRPRQFEHPDAWNNLRLCRGVWSGEYGGWLAPFRDLPFAFAAESARGDAALAARLAASIGAWDESAPAHVVAPTDPATTAALRALGYVE